MTAQTSVEAVARRLCIAANYDPDWHIHPHCCTRIWTPGGSVWVANEPSEPLWRQYERMARAVLDDLAAGRLG